MHPRLTQEFVSNEYAKGGYTLTSIYKNCMTKDEVVCPEGHKIKIKFNNFKSGYRCIECANNNKKLSHEFVFNEYAKKGYILNSIYDGCVNKDDLICPNNHKIKMTYNNFQSGNECIECVNINQTFSHEFVSGEYSKKGYTLNSIYNGIHNKDQLTCPEGDDIEITFANFKQGRRCGICFKRNNFGENHHSYNSNDRTRRKRSEQLSFDLRSQEILNDDPNYEQFLLACEESKLKRKLTGNKHIKSDITIDHIFPRIAFIDNDLDNIYGTNTIKKICNLRENLRIISKSNNCSKGGKYIQEEFMSWFNDKIKEYA